MYDLNNLVFYASVRDSAFAKAVELMDKSPKEGYQKLKQCVLKPKTDKPLASTPYRHALLTLILEDSTINRQILSGDQGDLSLYFDYEMQILSELFSRNFKAYAQEFDSGLNILDHPAYPVTELELAFLSSDAQQIFNALKKTLEKEGIGPFKDAMLFRLNEKGSPRACIPGKFKPFSQIIGYEHQKQAILENTKALIQGKGAMHTLLYGDMGTGKSSMVKALSIEFQDTPLKMIEVHKGQFQHLRKLFSLIRSSNHVFILFIDDLSFEDGDEDFKAFKNALEGSFEDVPSNMVIYATSNKRGLVTQTMSERTDAVNQREVVEEKNSLLSRFGLTLQFSAPQQDLYLDIVRQVAEDNGIDTEDDEFEAQALRFAIRHLNRSGRTAEQFIRSKMKEKLDD